MEEASPCGFLQGWETEFDGCGEDRDVDAEEGQVFGFRWLGTALVDIVTAIDMGQKSVDGIGFFSGQVDDRHDAGIGAGAYEAIYVSRSATGENELVDRECLTSANDCAV